MFSLKNCDGRSDAGGGASLVSGWWAAGFRDLRALGALLRPSGVLGCPSLLEAGSTQMSSQNPAGTGWFQVEPMGLGRQERSAAIEKC